MATTPERWNRVLRGGVIIPVAAFLVPFIIVTILFYLTPTVLAEGRMNTVIPITVIVTYFVIYFLCQQYTSTGHHISIGRAIALLFSSGYLTLQGAICGLVQTRALSGDVAFLCMLSGIAMAFSASAMSRGLPTQLSAARSASLALARLVGMVAVMAVGASLGVR
jgi:hypothetical protein